ncbi:BsuPI-related putative proteinase inhibitor [Paenibacillus xerothermodurans]|uniref:Intracellular proteinase inhibitor BsuPI domain-containing protein n=1 Tax=Paenibacillus xerothermodurans TaxID=1977292 RepID=A0A2W1NX61_PAEXE|nr:BsuPI-related putative proteinase inhibitor [Paenibacillus xerothermodurans]PZE22306.1 hypothetical protein CBW46_000475 [Paenibacillus xerothermodurans]
MYLGGCAQGAPQQAQSSAVILAQADAAEHDGSPINKTPPAQMASGLFKTALVVAQEDGRMKLNFSVHNTSGKDLSISHGSGQHYDIVVYDSLDQEVYRWSVNKAFTQALIVRTLQKDDQLSFNEVWDLLDSEGKRAPPGDYKVQVHVMIGLKNAEISPDELTDTVNVTIR